MRPTTGAPRLVSRYPVILVALPELTVVGLAVTVRRIAVVVAGGVEAGLTVTTKFPDTTLSYVESPSKPHA